MIKLIDLLFETFSKEINDIEQYVERNSYFEVSDKSEHQIHFVTRENGSVGDETPGQEDYKEAQRLKKQLERDYKDIKVTIDTIDEWTDLRVDFSESEKHQIELNRVSGKEYKNQISNIEKFVEDHIVNNLPHLSTENAVGKELKKTDYLEKTESKYEQFFNMDLGLRSEYYIHTFDIGWIDTDVPKSQRKKDFDKYIKQLKRDIHKKFRLSKFINDKYNDLFDVTYVGGTGMWMTIKVTSPKLKLKMKQ